MTKTNSLSGFIQFIIGGSFFAGGMFLLSNQVMVRAPMVMGGRYGSSYSSGWGSGFAFPWGSPGMGLLLLPLGIGLCLGFAGRYKKWSNLLIWASLAALLVGVLNSIRMTFVPSTLWQLGVYITMIGIGGGLMFKSVKDFDAGLPTSDKQKTSISQYNKELKDELEALKREIRTAKKD
ncbi:hypothetical protein OAL60_00720 [bacterium]|nr:hypothetical protein [bacterium]